MNNYIYVDNSSTTRLNSHVLSKMMPYLTTYYGNASTTYELGKISRKAIEESRVKVAELLNVAPEEIYFTGSGTEADNIAIYGIAMENKHKGNHIITSKFEHLAVLNTCKKLEREGFDVTYVDIEKNGIIDVNKIKEAIRKDTILISIMYVNNEIGTIQKIDEIAKLAKENNILFHTDAVQAIPHIKINASNYDALSLSAHKFNGPKGVGVLYLKKGLKIENLICGGHQECGLRPGTENVAGIIGLSEAMKITYENLEINNTKERKLRDYLLNCLREIPGFVLNGDMSNRVNSNINFYFEDIDSDELKLFMEMNNIYVSTGSACNSQVKDISHVLKAIGVNKSSIRISISHENNMYEMNKIAYVVKDSVKILRKQRIY